MPTVPEYPQEDWMTALGAENGSRKQWQMAMMEPKKAIPESGMAESEKVLAGALGSGRATSQLQPINWQDLQNRYMKVDLP